MNITRTSQKHMRMTRQKLWHIGMILICLITAPKLSYAVEIEDVRFGTHKNFIRLVLDLGDSQQTNFRAFALSSPYRIVIDLPDFGWNAGRPNRPPLSLVQDIRQGPLMPGISRIVFDFRKAVMIQNAFILPSNSTTPLRLAIDYKVVTPEELEQQKSKIFGALKVQEQLASNQSEPFNQLLNNYTDEAENSPAPADFINYKVAMEMDGIPRPPPNALRPKTASQNPFDTKKDGTSANTKFKKPLIVIDPGHGGQDPGALGPNKIYEKTVVLALGKELKSQLLASGRYNVKLTRESDFYIRLKDRIKFAREHQADLFISLHADSIHKSDVRGTSVYTLSRKASDAQTAKLAERENQADMIAGVDFEIEDEQVAFILGDFLMNDTQNQSKFFANTLVTKLQKNKVRTLNNPHRYAGFAVLKAPDTPSVLIESGFMSNKQEARLLNRADYRKELAKAIKDGIDAYFVAVRNNENN